MKGNGKCKEKNDDYRNKIEAAVMPQEVEEAALNELNRLESLGQGSAEENVIRSYLDF